MNTSQSPTGSRGRTQARPAGTSLRSTPRLNTALCSVAFLLAACAGQSSDSIGPITAVAPGTPDSRAHGDIARRFEAEKKNAVVAELPAQF